MDSLTSLLHTPTGWAIVFLFATAVWQSYRFSISSRPHFPPGPRPDPLIGNLRQIPLEYQEKTFAEWGIRYGDVIYATLLGKEMIILNTLQAARDLLEKRSAIYSDRPRFVLLTELMGWQDASTHIRYGPRFRKHRRLIQQSFNAQAILAFRPLQEQELGIFLDGLLKAPETFMQHLKRYAAGTIMKVTYGHTVKSTDDVYVRLAEEAGTATVESGSPAATLVDFFPVMKYLPTWMPGAGFKRKALEVRKLVKTMMDVPFEMVKSNMRAGIASPSFTSSLLEAHSKAGDFILTSEDEEDIKGAAGTLYAAAEDTTVCVISTFLLAMLRHPEVFQKAQNEMDQVVGHDRLPNFDDVDSLPYLDCVLREVYRWNPPVPLGLPHRLMEDDIYSGYHIPRGAMVLANIWAMSRACSQPDLFRPERFMDSPDIPDPRAAVFGFGRRICPGRHFAQTSVWLAVANITATLRLSKALDSNGKEITPVAEFTSGFVRHPKPFTCSLQPRSKKVMELLHHATADAEL